MNKKLLALVASFALSLPVLAGRQMCVKQKNGEIVKFDVEDVDEVYYINFGNDPDDSTAVDVSETLLKFNILSDSSVEVVKDFSYCELESVSIPAKVRIDGEVYTVTSIASWAFAKCSDLTNIEIPSTVTSIGESAFSGCIHLTVVIDEAKGKVKIGTGALDDCKSVKYTK